jgi:hypothetical protein
MRTTDIYVHLAGSIQLNSINAIAYVQRSATVSKRKSSAHFTAMAEMVVPSAPILELLQRHLVISISNETLEQLHPSQVAMKNAIEQIYMKILASVLIPHRRRILPTRAAIGQDLILRMGKFSRRGKSLGRKWKRKRAMRRRKMSRREMRKMRLFQTMTWSTV